ncbi:MAG: hypothetical protein R3B95_07840 [Nitrospirales bacterium]|nr:hypothetical protein [Nitrospirales bacterium]
MMVFCLLILVVASPVQWQEPDIGAPSSGLFAKVGKAVLQEFVDFFEGPVGLAVAILGMVFAVGLLDPLHPWGCGTRVGRARGHWRDSHH